MADNVGKTIFKTVNEGDRPSAAEHNKIVRAIQDSQGNKSTSIDYAQIRLLQMAEKMGKFSLGDLLDESYDREANLLWWKRDPITDGIQETTTDKRNFSDPFNLIYDDNEKLLGFYSTQHGRYYPLNPRTVRHAITVADDVYAYPARSTNPDSYCIKFVKITFTKDAGAQRIAVTKLDDTIYPDAVVHNIADPAEEGSYIPLGTLIEVYNVTDSWFTEWHSDPATVPFRNESSYEVPPYGCMRITGWDYTDKLYLCNRPDGSYFDSQYLINGPTAVAAPTGDPLVYSESFGRFTHDTGLTIACGGGTPVANQCWGPQPDSFVLRQHSDGFLAMRPGETGYLRAMPYPILNAIGKCTSGISKGSSGSVNIYYGTTPSDSGFDLTCRALGAAILADKWVKCERMNGQWIVGPAECG